MGFSKYKYNPLDYSEFPSLKMALEEFYESIEADRAGETELSDVFVAESAESLFCVLKNLEAQGDIPCHFVDEVMEYSEELIYEDN